MLSPSKHAINRKIGGQAYAPFAVAAGADLWFTVARPPRITRAKADGNDMEAANDTTNNGPGGRKIAAVIPCYGESGHVGAVVRGAAAAGFPAIVVDDGSPDGTADEARKAGAAHVEVHEKNAGKGAAMATGLAKALELGFDAAVLMDGDGQHDPAELPRFAAAFEAGADVVLGSRMADAGRKMPLVRYLTNRFMSAMLSRKMGMKATDTQCGYRLLSRKAAETVLKCRTQGFAADSEQLLLLARAGFRFAEVPVSTIYGDEKSKIRPVRDAIKFFAMLRKYR